MTIRHSGEVPLQAPLQPVNTLKGCAVAVTTTVVFHP
jgi:hypothetical protein